MRTNLVLMTIWWRKPVGSRASTNEAHSRGPPPVETREGSFSISWEDRVCAGQTTSFRDGDAAVGAIDRR
jgi:hypothetical protein